MKKLIIAVILFFAATLAGTDVLMTIAEQVRSELGATTTASYDKLRTVSVSVNPQENSLNAVFELYVSSDNAKPAIRGSYIIDTVAGTARVLVERLGIDTGVTLTAPQITSVQNSIDAHRDNVENSLISFGLVDGTQQ